MTLVIFFAMTLVFFVTTLVVYFSTPRNNTKNVWFIENYPESAERSEVFFE